MHASPALGPTICTAELVLNSRATRDRAEPFGRGFSALARGQFITTMTGEANAGSVIMKEHPCGPGELDSRDESPSRRDLLSAAASAGAGVALAPLFTGCTGTS